MYSNRFFAHVKSFKKSSGFFKIKENKYLCVLLIDKCRDMYTQRSRIEYIRCVDTKAEELDRHGYDVKADIGGWSKPPTIMGMVPDIRAKRADKVIIGKMLREEELDSVERDYRKFIEFADKDVNTSFRVYVISEDIEPKLHKIY
jgi:hypothetical protein